MINKELWEEQELTTFDYFMIWLSIYIYDSILIFLSYMFIPFMALNEYVFKFKFEILSNDRGWSNNEDIMLLDPSKKIVVFATDPDIAIQETVSYINTINDLMTDNMQFVIKVHPSESKNKYLKISKNNNIKAIVTKDLPLHILPHCDLLIHIASAIVLEAVLCKTSIITLSFLEDIPEYMDCVKEGISLEAKNKVDLKQKIKLALHDVKTRERMNNARDKYVKSHCCGIS